MFDNSALHYEYNLNVEFPHVQSSSLFLFNFILIYFINTAHSCHILTWIHHVCTVPQSKPSSHLLQFYIISLIIPVHSALLNPDSTSIWTGDLLVSFILDSIHSLQCHSPQSSHPSLSPQSPKVHLYTCVSFMPCWLIGHH